MNDFVTRLAERAMGTAPIVQPLVPSVFAPETNGPRLEETPADEPAPQDHNDQRPYRQAEQTPMVPHAPRLVPGDEEAHNDSLGTSLTPDPEGAPVDLSRPTKPEPSGHGPPSKKSEAPSRKRDTGESGPLERRVEPDPQNPSPTVPVARPQGPDSGPPRSGEVVPGRSVRDPSPSTQIADRTPPARPRSETIQRIEPTLRGGDETPGSLVPAASSLGSPKEEGGAGHDTIRMTKLPTESGRVKVATSAPPPDSNGSPKAGDTPQTVPAIVPRTVVRRQDQAQEGGPRESRVFAAEPPTIRVAIGRIEVRAITPQAPLARQDAPPRTTPLLSLDDYLEQRNGGRP